MAVTERCGEIAVGVDASYRVVHPYVDCCLEHEDKGMDIQGAGRMIRELTGEATYNGWRD